MIHKNFENLISDALHGIDGDMDRHEMIGKICRNLRESDQQ